MGSSVCAWALKLWEEKDQITSLKIESDLIDLELEIDRKRGRQSVHKITQQGFKIAQQGLQECADTEFDAMERGKKRIRTGQEPRTSEDKVRSTASETEVKSTYSDLTFSDESLSSSIPLTNDFSETTSQESPVSNQELEDTETIPLIIINEDGDVITDKKMMRDAYLKIRQDLCDHFSQKDVSLLRIRINFRKKNSVLIIALPFWWFIEGYNVSDAFRKYQISNIDKLVAGETFHFSSDNEEILSLHNIMFIDLTTMKKPFNRLRPVSDEYEMEINDIDELHSERRLFETTQAVARAFFERMHILFEQTPKVYLQENTEKLMKVPKVENLTLQYIEL
ncbi:unnamed protein product [Rhizophagus irregularis]|uniref:Uncharacterized protein n=1 Tax=Rhizophagus irregularis TaxID=588596 RepID=A0A916ED76_9GLOM|nr:unnamed protein product [Rhizophagus irregularis]